MRLAVFTTLVSLTLLAVACGGGSSSKTPTSAPESACGGAAAAPAVSCASVDETPVSEATEPPPAALSFDGIPQTGLTLGDPNAALEIGLYQNFLCSHCREFALTVLPQIINQYISTGRARLTFHHVALGGDSATNAHEAAQCAADQGQFWPAYSILYKNFSENDASYTKASLESLLASITQSSTLKACLDGDKYAALIATARDEFAALPDQYPAYKDTVATETAGNLPGLPVVSIDGTILGAPETFAEVKAAIDAHLP